MINNDKWQIIQEVMYGKDKKDAKLKIIKACAFPAAIYGFENWTIGNVEEDRINSFEMTCKYKIKNKEKEIRNHIIIPPNWLMINILKKTRKLKKSQ